MKLRSPVIVTIAAVLSAALGPAFAQEAPTYPEPVTRVETGDWVVECFAETPRPEQCQIYQRILIGGGTAIAMVTTMAYGADGMLSMQVALPLGIALSEGAVIAVEDRGFQLSVDRCTKQGCLVDTAVPAELLQAMRTGGTASLTVVSPGDGNFAIPLSLVGFEDALSQITPPPPPPPPDEPVEEPQPPLVPDPDEEEADEIDDALAPVTNDG